MCFFLQGVFIKFTRVLKTQKSEYSYNNYPLEIRTYTRQSNFNFYSASNIVYTNYYYGRYNECYEELRMIDID